MLRDSHAHDLALDHDRIGLDQDQEQEGRLLLSGLFLGLSLEQRDLFDPR